MIEPEFHWVQWKYLKIRKGMEQEILLYGHKRAEEER